MTRGNVIVEVGQVRKRIQSVHSIIKRVSVPCDPFIIIEINGPMSKYLDSNGEMHELPTDFLYEFTELVK